MHAACDFQVHVPSWQPGIKVPLDVLDFGLLAPTRRSLRGWSQSQRPGPSLSEGMTAAAIASAALADEAADSEAIAALVAAPAASSTSQHVRAREVTTVEINDVPCYLLFKPINLCPPMLAKALVRRIELLLKGLDVKPIVAPMNCLPRRSQHTRIGKRCAEHGGGASYAWAGRQ